MAKAPLLESRAAPAPINRMRRRLMATLLLPFAAARADTVHEASLKARLAYNLARFAQWPASAFVLPTDPMVICVPQASVALAAAFAEFGGQPAGGRPIKVVTGTEAVQAACHVLFVQEEPGRAVPRFTAGPPGRPTLVIVDGEGFAGRGAMVELVNVNDSLRFDVNLGALRAAQLGLSSQVLKLARQVRE